MTHFNNHHYLTRIVMVALAAGLSLIFGSYFAASHIVIPGNVLAGMLLFAGLCFVIASTPDNGVDIHHTHIKSH